MTEHELLSTPKEAEPAVEAKTLELATRTTSQTAQKPTKNPNAKTDTATAEEKRLARNAALREWRKKNKDRVRAYMTEWRTKRSGKRSEELAKSTPATPAITASKPTTKRAKPSKRTKKSKAKKGGKA